MLDDRPRASRAAVAAIAEKTHSPARHRPSAPALPILYTKTGDDGSTGMLFGGRLSKDDPAIELCGAIDEAVAALGLARASLTDAHLQARVLDLQRGLFVAAAEIAANPSQRTRLQSGTSRVSAEMTADLERAIDELLAASPLRPAFVVPGATLASAALDLARTAVRRAERRLVSAGRTGMPVSRELAGYMNRASDLIYALARGAAGDREEPLSHA